MIFGNHLSLPRQIQSYLRYGLHIAKKTEVNRRLTNHDNYKQKMIEKYLDRSDEIKDSGIYSMIGGSHVQRHLQALLHPNREHLLDNYPQIDNQKNEIKNEMKSEVNHLQYRKRKQINQYQYFQERIPYGKTEKTLASSANEKYTDGKEDGGSIKNKDRREYGIRRDRDAHHNHELTRERGLEKDIQKKREDLRIRRQKVLNEMAQARGDANKLHDLNMKFSMIENELRNLSS